MESPDPGGQRTVPSEGPGKAPVLSEVLYELSICYWFSWSGSVPPKRIMLRRRLSG